MQSEFTGSEPVTMRVTAKCCTGCMKRIFAAARGIPCDSRALQASVITPLCQGSFSKVAVDEVGNLQKNRGPFLYCIPASIEGGFAAATALHVFVIRSGICLNLTYRWIDVVNNFFAPVQPAARLCN